jgi:hypothetical protein
MKKNSPEMIYKIKNKATSWAENGHMESWSINNSQAKY